MVICPAKSPEESGSHKGAAISRLSRIRGNYENISSRTICIFPETCSGPSDPHSTHVTAFTDFHQTLYLPRRISWLNISSSETEPGVQVLSRTTRITSSSSEPIHESN